MAGKAKAEPATQTSQTSPYPGVSKANQHKKTDKSSLKRCWRNASVNHPGLDDGEGLVSQIHLSHSSAAVSDNAVGQTGRGFSSCSTRCSEDIICRDLTGVGRFLVISISWSFHSWINPCLLLASMYFLVQTALCFH